MTFSIFYVGFVPDLKHILTVLRKFRVPTLWQVNQKGRRNTDSAMHNMQCA